MSKRQSPVYSPDVVDRIRQMVRDGLPRDRIAKAIGVTRAAIEACCYSRGIKLPHRARSYAMPKAVYSKGRNKWEKREADERGISKGQLAALRRHRRKVQMLGVRRKQTLAELQAIARASSIPITKLPIGAHAGWTPSWL